MVAVSRELFTRAIGRHGDQVCRVFVHPHEPSCLKAHLEMMILALKGGVKYFTLMYLAENGFKYKTLSTANIKPITKSFIRSLALGVWCVSACTGFVCLIRKLTGTISRDSLAYATGITSGLGVYLADANRRPIMGYTLAAIAVEALLRRLYRKVKRSEAIETIVFMVLNGILMYKMRVTELATCRKDMWFFRPLNIRSGKELREAADGKTGDMNGNSNSCKACNKQQCLVSILKITSKYCGGALIFTAVKLLATKPALRRNPLLFMKTLSQWKNLRLACFFGWYVGVYQGVNCLLCRWRKQDAAEHAVIAGFLAGVSYRINSSLTLLGTIVLYVARILGRECQNKLQIPDLHFVELHMILALGVLVNTKLFDPQSCPGGFRFIIDTMTQGKIEKSFLKMMSEINAQKAMDAAKICAQPQ